MISASLPDFALFLHALATEFDEQAGAEARDSLLRAVGRRMAARCLPPECVTLSALEIEINEILARLGWGRIELELVRQDQALVICHEGLPRLGAVGSPPGQWLAATLEGLLEIWLTQQSEAPGRYTVKRDRVDQEGASGRLVFRLRAGDRAQTARPTGPG